MTPAEIRLFTAKEQTLLVEVQPDRLREASEEELADLLVRVRRLRDKYSGLHRRQGAASVESAGKRYSATTSNKRTIRKAELLEDSLSRVSLALSRAARSSANDLKRARIEAARADRAVRPRPADTGGGPRGPETRRPGAGKVQALGRARSGNKVTARRIASTRATTARQQARRDRRH